MMLFWMARRTVRGLTRPKRHWYGDADWSLGLSMRQSWIVLLVIFAPFWFSIAMLIIWGIIAAIGGIGHEAMAFTWSSSALEALGVGAVVVAVLGLLYIIGRRSKPLPPSPPALPPPDFPPWEQLGGGGPDNPAKWSDRR